MKAIKDGDQLPPFPFQVVCIDNSGREEFLTTGKTYTVSETCGDSLIAGPDIILNGIEFTFSIRRFSVIVGEADTADWRTWRDHGVQSGHCPCRILREQCWIHR